MKLSKLMAFMFSAAVLLVAGCGGVINATIGGTVTGLSGGTTMYLQDNGGDTLKVTANGSFTFATQIEAGSTYYVTVETQPTVQTSTGVTEPADENCTVSNGAGTVSQSVGNVTSILISCNVSVTATNEVSGQITGLNPGNSVTLLDNGTDKVTPTENGFFSFPTALVVGATYTVSVSVQPSGQTCTVTPQTARGTIPSTGNITLVQVQCT